MLAAKGWRIFIADLNDVDGPVEAARIGATFYKTDLRSYDSVRDAFGQLWASAARLDFVFANAGITDPRSLYDDTLIAAATATAAAPDEPPAELDLSVIDINLKAQIQCARLARHYFRLTRRALAVAPGGGEDYDPCLVFTSSLAALLVIPEVPLYSAAKSGLVSFMRAVAPVYKERDGIRVSCICPGRVDTGMTRRPGIKFRPPEQIVSMETVCEGVSLLLEPGGGFGRCLQLIPAGISDVEAPPRYG